MDVEVVVNVDVYVVVNIKVDVVKSYIYVTIEKSIFLPSTKLKWGPSHSIYMGSISEKSESDSDRFDPKILNSRVSLTLDRANPT